MGDEEKREARRFEPPPWEKEAFEALARKKADEQEALEVLAAAQAAAGAPAVEPTPASQPPAEAEVQSEAPALEDEPAAAAPAGAESDAPAAPAASAAPSVDERQVKAMLLELGREETTPTSHIQLISRIASIVTGIAGTGMVIGGISALQTAGTTPVGVMGSSALSVFGLCFVGMAVWVWVRSNRVRGSR
jgi:hypothetical protein